jgi:hypothetical protein
MAYTYDISENDLIYGEGGGRIVFPSKTLATSVREAMARETREFHNIVSRALAMYVCLSENGVKTVTFKCEDGKKESLDL